MWVDYDREISQIQRHSTPPTSLPGPHGIGEIGPEAFRFADWLAEAGQKIWQVLPLGPTGYGDSPYQCFSAFAGNPLLLSLDRLVERGYLDSQDLATRPTFPEERADYGGVIESAGSLPEVRSLLGSSCRRDHRRNHGTFVGKRCR